MFCEEPERERASFSRELVLGLEPERESPGMIGRGTAPGNRRFVGPGEVEAARARATSRESPLLPKLELLDIPEGFPGLRLPELGDLVIAARGLLALMGGGPGIARFATLPPLGTRLWPPGGAAFPLPSGPLGCENTMAATGTGAWNCIAFAGFTGGGIRAALTGGAAFTGGGGRAASAGGAALTGGGGRGSALWACKDPDDALLCKEAPLTPAFSFVNRTSLADRLSSPVAACWTGTPLGKIWSKTPEKGSRDMNFPVA